MKYVYNNEVLILFLLWFAISNIFNFTNLIFFMGIFFLLAVVFIIRYYQNNGMKKKFISNISYYYMFPRPITSMMDALSLEGYTVQDIKKIDFMAYSLSETCNYGYKKISKIVESNQNIKINIIGYGKNNDCPSEKKYINNIEYFPTNNKRTEHKNLIYMNDNKTFLWYEPYHKIENEKHDFKRKGGYFLKPNQKVLETIEEDIASLKKH